VRYVFASTIDAAPTPPPPPGSDVPGLPDLLERIRTSLARQDQLLIDEPAEPSLPQGGWLDRNHDGRLDADDELLVDLFEPGTENRTYDFSSAEPVVGAAEPRGVITPTEQLPAARCGYRKWHVDTLLESKDVGTTDGMSFSPDGAKLALPIKVDGRYEVHVADADGHNAVCLTCDSTAGWDDGVRWRPGADVLLFVSSRDHPGFIGGAGGGAGQELYAMRADGSQQTRLTVSPDWATNYHANWSSDGRRIVWGSTSERTWDVLVADFVDDAGGMRLENVRRLTHDTSWWETHGFTPSGDRVITTNTRAGWQSADIYTVDVATGARTRITDELSWDEHAHLSPDGRKLSWISARWRPAGMLRLTNGSLSPIQDYFWIAPAILFSFYNPPAGFSTELTLMDADGGALQRLTLDDQVVADNQWSPDGRRIVFRQTPTRPRGPSRIALLTFDDCGE
jgi:Tol biopolymer transport system component